MLADARLLAHKPKNLSFAEAASLPVVSITAWETLFKRAKIQAGDEILIHGATGGVGHIAVQLAKWAGAKVYTTVSIPEKAHIAKEFGADVVINYNGIIDQTVIKSNLIHNDKIVNPVHIPVFHIVFEQNSYLVLY